MYILKLKLSFGAVSIKVRPFMKINMKAGVCGGEEKNIFFSSAVESGG